MGHLLKVPISKVIESYILNAEVEQRSKKTIEGYRGNLGRFLWFAQKNGYPESVGDLQPDHIRKFLVYVSQSASRWDSKANTAQHSVTPATVQMYYKTLKAMFNWAKTEGFLEKNPMDNIKSPKLPKVVIPIYADSDIAKLLALCENSLLGIRNRALILMALDTGLRLSELLSIKLDDVSITGGLAKVHGKGAKERVVHFGKITKQALIRYLMTRPTQGTNLWLTEEGKPLAPAGFRVAFKRMAKKAGLSGRTTVHQLRHTFGTLFLDSGDPLTLQYLLGHSTLAMTQRYTESKRASQAIAAHEKSSPVEKMLGKD